MPIKRAYKLKASEEVQSSLTSQLEKKLRESNEKLQQFVQNVKDYAIIMLDPEGRIISWNLGAEALMGFQAEEIIGEHFSRFYTEEGVLADEPALLLKASKEQGKALSECLHMRKDGTLFYADIVMNSVYDENGTLSGFVKITRDITERKHMEAELDKANKNFMQMFNTSPDAAIVTNLSDGVILYINDGFTHLSGYTRDDVIGKSSIGMELYESLADRERIVGELREKGYCNNLEVLFKRKDKSIFVGLFSAKVINLNGNTNVSSSIRDITELKKLEVQLKQNFKDLQEAQRIAHIGTWSLDVETNQVVWSDELYRMYGFDPSIPPPPYTEHMKLFTPESWEKLSTALEITRTSGTPYELELETVLADGSNGWMWVRGEANKDSSGNIISLGGAMQNISERVQVQKNIVASEIRYRRLFEAARDGILILDAANGRILDANPFMEEILGYSHEQFLAKQIWDLGFHDDIFANKANFTELQQQAYIRYENIPLETVNGNKIEVEFVSNSYLMGDKEVMQCNIRDITERTIQTYEKMKASEERLNLATRSGNIGIWDWDIVNNELIWDDSMYLLYNIRREDFNNDYDSWSSKLHPDDRQKIEESIQTALRGEREFDVEFRIVRPDDVLRYIKGVAKAYRDKNGLALRLIGVNMDITEQKLAEIEILKLNDELIQHSTQLEDARKEADEANHAKSEFLSQMSHELRTPLNSVLGFTQLLLMDELSPDQISSLEMILKSGNHLLALINEVLDIARIEAGNMNISAEPIRFAQILQNAIELIRPLAFQRGISIGTRIPSGRDIFVTADEKRLNQVFLNLLSNAVKYNRDDGEIVVAVDLQTDGYLHIVIQDTGEGIPPEKMKRLFTPFDRLGLEPGKVEGTGLGLALSKGFVEAMGGRIGAESIVGKGSSFWVNLKLTMIQKEEMVMAVVDEYMQKNPLCKKGLVLYVEDNLSNIQLIEKVLKRLPDVNLITAMQGSIALDLARVHKPVLILLDLHLPDMHGEKVLEQLRAMAETKDIPVIIMSADATKGQIDHMLAIGASAYLTKPIDVKQFLKTVGEMLEAINRN